MKKLILKLINLLGYKIEKINTHNDPKTAHADLVDTKEIKKLLDDLNAFSKKHPNCTAKEGKGSVNWSDISVTREYLTDLRIRQFHDLIKEVEKNNITIDNSSIVDVGSGTGYLLRIINNNYSNVKLTGFDNYKELNKLASFICPNAKILEKDIFSVFNSRYDIIFCTQTMEHLIDPKKAINNLLNGCNQNGALILTVPDGRMDRTKSVGKYKNNQGYWGHINFWSIESWEVFIGQSVKGRNFKVGMLASHNILYAIIHNNQINY